jgi:hypothetical protein
MDTYSGLGVAIAGTAAEAVADTAAVVGTALDALHELAIK